ncbi:CVNH domain-containing protein [Corynascus novoguineensis]|uniref:CVNH domain-containing protein n=1 Tax=Corynascus novoguineensis TaxID=1126955 RepID=A0AAN7CTK8_9PEZI|nr:CVNH domain-containing protein [Corynascus novoguineensis]
MTYHGQGEAASYYASAQQHQQQYPQQGQHGSGYGQPPQQHQQHGRDSHNDAQEGAQDGERGFLGAVGGGIAGAVGGNKIGGKVTGHSKTSTILGAVAGAIAGHKIQDGVEDWKDNRDEEKEKKRREEEEKRRKEEEKHRPHHAAAAPPKHHDEPRDRNLHYAGGFSGSSRDIRLDAHGEYMLHASCQRLDGSYQASSISLNKIIENDQGSFCWVSPGRRNNGGGGGQSTVTVQQGDTLRQIAARFNTSFEEIARHNNINNPDLIYPGQVLQIPGRSGGQCNNSSSEGGFGSSARNVRLSDGGSRLDGELQRDGRWVGSSLILDERIGNNNGTLTFVD